MSGRFSTRIACPAFTVSWDISVVVQPSEASPHTVTSGKESSSVNRILWVQRFGSEQNWKKCAPCHVLSCFTRSLGDRTSFNIELNSEVVDDWLLRQTEKKVYVRKLFFCILQMIKRPDHFFHVKEEASLLATVLVWHSKHSVVHYETMWCAK